MGLAGARLRLQPGAEQPHGTKWSQRKSVEKNRWKVQLWLSSNIVLVCRLRVRQIDWRYRSKRTSFDGMHTGASSDDEDPVTYLPEDRWAPQDIHTGRPDRGPDASPLDRVTGTFDTSFPANVNTLSSVYTQIGVDSFRKRIQHHPEGHLSLDLSGRIGSAAQLDLLPAMLKQYQGERFALILANNALKPDSLPILRQLTCSDTACGYLDLSQNDALLSSALSNAHCDAVSAFLATEDSHKATNTTDNTGISAHIHAVGTSGVPIVSSALSVLILNACRIHHSAAEALANGLLHQHVHCQSTQNCMNGTEQRYDTRGNLLESHESGESGRGGLQELHLAMAELDEGAMSALLSPAVPPPCPMCALQL